MYQDQDQELAMAARDEREINNQSLEERKEAQENFLDVMRNDPEAVAERIGWLLEGNYGEGQMLMARNTTKRMNRPSIFTQLVAVFEWRCPRNMAVAAWKKLSKAKQNRLQSAIEVAIHDFDASRAHELLEHFEVGSHSINFKGRPLAHVAGPRSHWVLSTVGNHKSDLIKAATKAIAKSPKNVSSEVLVRSIVDNLLD